MPLIKQYLIVWERTWWSPGLLIYKDKAKNVLHYCNINQLSINFKKTNYLQISPPQKATNVILSNVTRKTHIKYLGVFIDEHLNWGPQILHINNKVSCNMGMINKLKYYLDNYSYFDTIIVYTNLSVFELWYY